MATKFYNAANTTMAAVVNGDSNEMNEVCGPKGLDIAIVGAGIGGLGAAIGLRRAGHNVSV
jgi:ribulose 1,5-bisphosphate synthetase/thiazole synthase